MAEIENIEIKLYKNKEWLHQKYIVKKLSSYKIAKICGCGNATIWRWLTKHDIKIRTRSEAKIGKLHPQYGKFGKDSPVYRPLEERLWVNVDRKNNISESWPWMGCKHSSGHGKIGGGDGKNRYAHAVMYEIFYKDKVGKGEVVHHLCENPSCCNPFHLIKMTRSEHLKLHNGGEKCYNAKLTWEKVRQIREEYTGRHGEQAMLAKKYNVSCDTISKIVNNKIWR